MKRGGLSLHRSPRGEDDVFWKTDTLLAESQDHQHEQSREKNLQILPSCILIDVILLDVYQAHLVQLYETSLRVSHPVLDLGEYTALKNKLYLPLFKIIAKILKHYQSRRSLPK